MVETLRNSVRDWLSLLRVSLPCCFYHGTAVPRVTSKTALNLSVATDGKYAKVRGDGAQILLVCPGCPFIGSISAQVKS